MKGKLIKTEVNYLLEDNKGIVIASTSLKGEGINLSKRNCDEIFGVVDVEKLACKEIKIDIDTYKDIHKKATEKNASPCIPSREGGCVGANLYSQVNGFIKGYNKAMELNKEKLFTLEDVRNAIELAQGGSMQEVHNGYGISTELTFVLDNLSTDEIIQSIQQPKEIDVEVVTLIDYFDSSNKLYLSTDEAAKYCTDTGIPHTDDEGNLILIKL